MLSSILQWGLAVAKNVERRLAAILAADVVGYSRLMGDDELSTLSALKAHREELIDAKIAEHYGRIVKVMGDGLLVEFSSVVEAVECAVEMQNAMTTRNAEVPEERRIQFRVGINLGDVIVENDDIFGDGGVGRKSLGEAAFERVSTELLVPSNPVGAMSQDDVITDRRPRARLD